MLKSTAFGNIQEESVNEANSLAMQTPPRTKEHGILRIIRSNTSSASVIQQAVPWKWFQWKLRKVNIMHRNLDNDELQLLTVKQVSNRLCCSVANVYALIAAGTLAVVQVGKSKGYRIDLRDLETFIQERKFRFLPTQSKPKTTTLRHIRI